MSDRPIYSQRLRDEYEVRVRPDGTYSVVLIDRHGTRHEDLVMPETVSVLRDRLRGREVDKDQAGAALVPAAERLNLPFTYGYKLAHYATKVLLVLVARKEAGVEKVGRKFVFIVY